MSYIKKQLSGLLFAAAIGIIVGVSFATSVALWGKDIGIKVGIVVLAVVIVGGVLIQKRMKRRKK